MDDKKIQRITRFLYVVNLIIALTGCDEFVIDRTTKVSGKITDAATGLAVENAKISVKGQSGITLFLTPSKTFDFVQTDTLGDYAIVFEAEDKDTFYSIYVSAKGFESQSSSIKVGKKNERNVHLQPQ
jgi:hypothetical protein